MSVKIPLCEWSFLFVFVCMKSHNLKENAVGKAKWRFLVMSDNSRVFFYFVFKRTFSNIKTPHQPQKHTNFNTLDLPPIRYKIPHIHPKSVKNLGVIHDINI